MSRSEAARGRWTITVSEPVENPHDPEPDCENCGGRGCMGCIFREYDHDCADNCPICCHDNFQTEEVEVVPASSLSLALEALRELIPWAEAAEDSPEVGRNGPAELDAALTRARAVLDQLEEGERSQTASTEGAANE
jgi:hypothetical protein